VKGLSLLRTAVSLFSLGVFLRIAVLAVLGQDPGWLLHSTDPLLIVGMTDAAVWIAWNVSAASREVIQPVTVGSPESAEETCR
jgi:hypothetical protein